MKDIEKAYSAIVLESNARLIRVWRFHEDKFMFPHFIQDALPRDHWSVGNRAG
jgi:hypothetical protein